jgi:hypothetical protein
MENGDLLSFILGSQKHVLGYTHLLSWNSLVSIISLFSFFLSSCSFSVTHRPILLYLHLPSLPTQWMFQFPKIHYWEFWHYFALSPLDTSSIGMNLTATYDPNLLTFLYFQPESPQTLLPIWYIYLQTSKGL